MSKNSFDFVKNGTPALVIKALEGILPIFVWLNMIGFTFFQAPFMYIHGTYELAIYNTFLCYT